MSQGKKNKNKTTTVSHKLADVVRRELGLALRKEHQRSDWSGDLEPGMLAYAAEDSRVLLLLDRTFAPRLTDTGLEMAAEIERRALPAVTWMALSGVPFDAEGCGAAWRGSKARWPG
jgi:ribonuclease D